MNECITLTKKTPKLHKRQHFFGFQLGRVASVLLEAGGKRSTWFPPEGLVELTPVALESNTGAALASWKPKKC